VDQARGVFYYRKSDCQRRGPPHNPATQPTELRKVRFSGRNLPMREPTQRAEQTNTPQPASPAGAAELQGGRRQPTIAIHPAAQHHSPPQLDAAKRNVKL
jgi:hypothetical protein